MQKQEFIPAGENQPVIAERRGRTGFLLLNRPKALNALNHEMIRTLRAQLTAWAEDPDVAQVIVHGAGERGLCAGGDIVAVYRSADADDGGAAAHRAFFTDEYDLDYLTSVYPKPYIALMDGIVLGGGLGLSAHGSVRVVTERARLGMPETGIGFVPDVGGTYLLSRAPGELGTYLALTGDTVGAGDALSLGLADWFLESSRIEDFLEALEHEDVHDVLERLGSRPGPGRGSADTAADPDGNAAHPDGKAAHPAGTAAHPDGTGPDPAGTAGIPSSDLAAKRAWIDECFSHDDALDIVAALRETGHTDVAETIESRSPTSVVVTLALLRDNAQRDLRACLDAELRAGLSLISSGEMIEGIRAQVIDKDRTPRWNPPTISEVSREHVDAVLGRTIQSEESL